MALIHEFQSALQICYSFLGFLKLNKNLDLVVGLLLIGVEGVQSLRNDFDPVVHRILLCLVARKGQLWECV